MKPGIFLKTGLAVLAIACAPSFSRAWDSRENSVWLEGSINGKFNENWALRLSERGRYIEHDFEYYYRHTNLELKWNITPAWYLTPAFRYVTVKTNNREESTPVWHINLGNKTSLAGLDFKSRLRLMYSDLNGIKDRTDFRPKLTVLPSTGWTGWNIKPYIAEEMMVNMNDGRFYRNRLSSGIICSPVKMLSLGAFIMQERTENKSQKNWSERYNTGLSAQLNF